MDRDDAPHLPHAPGPLSDSLRWQDGGWIAFTIKQDFLGEGDESGFETLIAELFESGRIEERGRRRYQHRLDSHGKPLHYVAIVGVKRST